MAPGLFSMRNTTDTILSAATLSKQQANRAIFIVGGLFFVFGFVSWVNAILIPYFKIACELNNFQSYLVTFAFYISYFIVSVPASRLLKKTGFRRGIMFGFWIMSLGAFFFVPAAYTRNFALFLVALFIIGTGLSVLQTAANPYITLLGPKEKAARRISVMGIFNKGAGILAPIVFAAVILKATDTDLFKSLANMHAVAKDEVLDQLIRRVVIPYICIGSILFLLGLLVRFSDLPEINIDDESKILVAANAGKRNILQFPHLVLGAVGIFFHVGTQVIAVDTIIGYASSMNMDLLQAKAFPSYTLGATIIGYIMGILFIPRIVSQLTTLKACTLLGMTFTLLIIFSEGRIFNIDISIWFVVLLGFANSMVWAGIWPLALDGLGRFTKTGASLMIMGLCGNALLPLAYGYLADKFNVRQAYWILFPCYAYLVFFAFYGHRIRYWTSIKTKKLHGPAIKDL